MLKSINKLRKLIPNKKRLFFCLAVGVSLGILLSLMIICLNIFLIQKGHDEHRATNVLRAIAPKDVVGTPLVRVGGNADGGYVMLDEFPNGSIAYSFGIGNEISWDAGIANRDINIYMYDHTIEKLPYNDEHFHFFRTGICGNNSNDKHLKSFEQLIKENKHENERNIILKIDTEGAEWDALADISYETMERCNQIIVELHWLNKIIKKEEYEKVINILRKINKTHQSIHVHATNFDSYDIICGEPIPNVIEVTYARKSNHKFIKNQKCYPIEGLDKPCLSHRYDYFLGFIGMLAE